MSYDIQFYSKSCEDKKVPSASDFNNYFNKNFPQISGEDEDWEYQNNESGTEFEITYYDPEGDWEDAETFDGFDDAGHSVGIELGGWGENGKEFCAFAEKLQNDLGSYIMDSQINDSGPAKYSANDIFAKWKEDNDWLSGINKIEKNL